MGLEHNHFFFLLSVLGCEQVVPTTLRKEKAMPTMWYVKTFGSHTNKFFERGFTRDTVRKECADGKTRDLISLEKDEVLQAMLSKEDQSLVFDVFCEVGFARPKRVDPKRSVRGSKEYVAATKWLKAQMTRRTARS